jgi:hypothetical protein
MSKVTIKDLVGKTDEQLAELFGFKEKVATAKEELVKIDKLEGKARQEAEDRISKMFEPHVYPGEFKWIREDAVRRATKKQTAKEALCDCSPSSVLD